VIARLEEAAAQEDIADGRNGNTNNPAFGQRAYQVNQLIRSAEAWRSGQPVRDREAFEPALVW
jgi:hypothetical protein